MQGRRKRGGVHFDPLHHEPSQHSLGERRRRLFGRFENEQDAFLVHAMWPTTALCYGLALLV